MKTSKKNHVDDSLPQKLYSIISTDRYGTVISAVVFRNRKFAREIFHNEVDADFISIRKDNPQVKHFYEYHDRNRSVLLWKYPFRAFVKTHKVSGLVNYLKVLFNIGQIRNDSLRVMFAEAYES